MQGHPGSSPLSSARSLLIGVIFFESIYIALLILRDWNSHIPLFLMLYFGAFVVYLYFAIRVIRGQWNNVRSSRNIILVASFVFRLTLFWCEPSLSEDLYRYIWDGRVQNAGLTPYGYPPQDPELAFLRNNDYEKINHKDFSTPYPPAAETYFRFLALISTNSFVFKFGIVLFDFGLILLLQRLLQSEKKDPSLLLLYAWHPLPVIEFAVAGHLDVIAMCLLFLTFWLLQRGLTASSGAILAIATLTKYLPMFSLPWLIRRGGWKMVAAGLLLTVLLGLQYYTPDYRMFSGLFTFYRKWWFNDSLFRILYSLLGGAEPARIAGGLGVLVALGFCWFRKYPVYRSLLIIYGTILVFSPVVHPWYVCWMIPLLAFHQNFAWLFFSGWVAIAYLIRYVYPVGEWSHDDWLLVLVYAPLYSLLLINWIRSRATANALPRF